MPDRPDRQALVDWHTDPAWWVYRLHVRDGTAVYTWEVEAGA